MRTDSSLLSASAHKFNGPKGVGFLYVRQGTIMTAFAEAGAQKFGMSAGMENVAGIVGMAAALKKNCDEMGHGEAADDGECLHRHTPTSED